MKKRTPFLSVFSLLVCILLTIRILTIGALAETPEIVAQGTFYEGVKWSLDTTGTFMVTGTGDMDYYSSYTEAPWHAYRQDILHVKIGEGITDLGEFTFFRCSNLTDVVLPESLRYISRACFSQCTGLTDVSIPESVTWIDDRAFRKCSSLDSITFLGSAPTFGKIPNFGKDIFTGVTATATFPCTDETWTKEKQSGYGGSIFWQPHVLEDFTYNQDATCSLDGTKSAKCTQCGWVETVLVSGTAIGHSFEGAFCINYYYTPSYQPKGDITMYYWNQDAYDAADVLTKENATAAIKMSGEGIGEYHAAVEGIAAKDLDKGVYVAFTYSDGTTTYYSGVLVYSIGAYCGTQANATDGSAPLAQATAVYGHYANKMFN